MIPADQETVIQAAVNHVKRGSKQVFEFTGGPGTGKTYCIHEIVKRLGIPPKRIAPMAYIGQAAIVMRIRGLYNARTIHSWLYDCIEEDVLDEHGLPVLDPVFNKPMKRRTFIPRDLNDIDLFIIDEGYTVPHYMKKDIESRGKPIIVCGDRKQLPPVEDKPAYLVNDDIMMLTQIMRQSAGNFIIELSNMVYDGIEPDVGLYGNVLVIDRDDITPDMIKNSQVIICGTNKTRDYYNNYVRREILHKTTTLPGMGERVMCRKNNWNIEVDGINLTNGLTGTVTKPADVYRFDGKTFTIDFRSDLLGLYFPDIKCDYQYFTATNRSQKEFLKNSKYSMGEKFEYAYSKTTHLCQGSQYYNGIYISEYLHKDIQRQLDFTAVSRFMRYMIYVRKKRKQYWQY